MHSANKALTFLDLLLTSPFSLVQGTRLACLPSRLRRSRFSYEGRELRRRHGGSFAKTYERDGLHFAREIFPGFKGFTLFPSCCSMGILIFQVGTMPVHVVRIT